MGRAAGIEATSARRGCVTFEHYDLPETVRKDDVHMSGNMKMAWFKDPDGDILSVVSGEM